MRVLVLMISGCMAIALAILGATPAIADQLPTKPAFGMMDNTGDGSEVVVELATIIPTGDEDDGALLHPRVLAQHVAPSGLGAYAGLSASKLVGTDADEGTFGVGSLELGGLYQRALSPELALGLRLGVILDTATEDSLSVNVAATALARPADLATATPENWFRLGVSPTFHVGSGFARIDAGLDVPMVDEFHPIGHLNLGAGFGTGRWSITAELGAVRELRDSNPELESEAVTLKIGGLAVRYHGESASPYVMVSSILNDDVRGEIITLTTGVAF